MPADDVCHVHGRRLRPRLPRGGRVPHRALRTDDAVPRRRLRALGPPPRRSRRGRMPANGRVDSVRRVRETRLKVDAEGCCNTGTMMSRVYETTRLPGDNRMSIFPQVSVKPLAGKSRHDRCCVAQCLRWGVECRDAEGAVVRWRRACWLGGQGCRQDRHDIGAGHRPRQKWPTACAPCIASQ